MKLDRLLEQEQINEVAKAKKARAAAKLLYWNYKKAMVVLKKIEDTADKVYVTIKKVEGKPPKKLNEKFKRATDEDLRTQTETFINKATDIVEKSGLENNIKADIMGFIEAIVMENNKGKTVKYGYFAKPVGQRKYDKK